MISVKLTYTVKPEFISRNLENIQTFLVDFQKMKDADFRYTVFLSEDQRTFLDLSSYANEEIQRRVLAVKSLKEFQRQRDARGMDGSHKIEVMKLIGSSHDIFR